MGATLTEEDLTCEGCGLVATAAQWGPWSSVPAGWFIFPFHYPGHPSGRESGVRVACSPACCERVREGSFVVPPSFPLNE